MDEVNRIISETKRTINITLIVFILLSLFNLASKAMNGTITTWSYVSVAIGIFIIFSLFRAKKWAKSYITICCVVIILMSLIPLFTQMMNGSYLLSFINLALIFWSIYLVRFLNIGEQYEKYSKIVNSGFDPTVKRLSHLNEIVPIERLQDFDRREFGNIEEYKNLTIKLLEKLDFSDRIETVRTDNHSLFIESAESEYKIEIESESIFFDNNYISGLNVIVSDLSENQIVSVVYPETTTNRKKYKIACLTLTEFSKLKANAMIA